MTEASDRPVVGILMGSKNDATHLAPAREILSQFGIAHEARVLSAHRTPEETAEYVKSAASRGIKALIAGAGGAAHLPGVVAAYTLLPVIGVPIPSTSLQGLDALLAIVQMPQGVPVATMAIGAAGAGNAALFVVRMLALSDAAMAERLREYMTKKRDEVLSQRVP